MKKSLQEKRPVWVAYVLWGDGSWGPFPAMGCGYSRIRAMEDASNFIKDNSVDWAMGSRTKFGFSNRIKFRKYFLSWKIELLLSYLCTLQRLYLDLSAVELEHLEMMNLRYAPVAKAKM